MNEITQVLEDEIKLNKKESWNKLDKTVKLSKLADYADYYVSKHSLSETLISKLSIFLKSKLNQKRLTTNKDVIYDVEKMMLVDIPNLLYVNETFVLERNNKRVSTVKSLTPTKYTNATKDLKTAKGVKGAKE
jgi:hypothetical protein